MHLLKTQKNGLFEILQRHDLSPGSFFMLEPDEERGRTHTIVRHMGSGFFISFKKHPDNQDTFIIEYSPAGTHFRYTEWLGNWMDVEKTIEKWATSLHREINEIDKWQRLREELKTLSCRKQMRRINSPHLNMRN